jgi:hypothetical protein
MVKSFDVARLAAIAKCKLQIEGFATRLGFSLTLRVGGSR